MELRTPALLVAFTLASACEFGPPESGGACTGPGTCAQDEVCCSTDPAALKLEELTASALPSYPGRDMLDGVPLFAGDRNDLTRRGTCIHPGSVPPHNALDNGCPIPCNPRWASEDVDAVCGVGLRCCQVDVLEADDCVLDPALGDAGCWRPATGEDIGTLTGWNANDHATHQTLGACADFVAGLGAEHDRDAVRSACERRLSVADQRGFCLPIHACREDLPDHRGACEQLNDEQGLGGC